MNRPLAALLLPLLLLASACTRTSSGPPLRSRPRRRSPTVPPSASRRRNWSDHRELVPGGPEGRLPDLRLPCFTGGEPVGLDAVRGPAVINLWASWCGPCRKELPAFQRLAGRTGGQLHVVGVDTRDDREAAQSLAADLGSDLSHAFRPG